MVGYAYFACLVKVSFHLHQVFSVVSFFQFFQDMILYIRVGYSYVPRAVNASPVTCCLISSPRKVVLKAANLTKY
jgi:hypothetical protein